MLMAIGAMTGTQNAVYNFVRDSAQPANGIG
jgi:hypothetical protein